MNKALKITLIILITVIALLLTGIAAYSAVTAGARLQPKKLIDYGKSISIYDDEGNKIEDASLTAKRKSVRLCDLSQDTVNAFIASEDREFYRHRGLNYRRMVKALMKNISTMSFKEGASTISQQLIKNTHLTGDKTIARKLKEIKLTKQLEKRYSKDEILEMYLNTIYFGHNCYGIQSAANFYFGKNAESLTVEESAALVGLLVSPNNYSPYKNSEKCMQRRNTVLKCMVECGYLNENKYNEAKQTPIITCNKTDKAAYSDYYEAIFDELDGLELLPEISLSEYKIETYLDTKLQKSIENIKADCDKSIVVRRNDGGVAAFCSTIGQAKRQIGSTAKPIFVYAPAIEEKKLHIFTKICDEPVNFGGYTPENYDKKYRGKVSVTDCIAQSLNVPAVKTLNNIGINTSEKYANKMGIELENDEKNLALALGGMKYGLDLVKLSDCYSIFQNGGTIKNARFIKKITDKNGKTMYENSQTGKKVFSQGTCSLINRALCEAVNSGTAKKLKKCGLDIACKTGTCGTEEGNTDAYAISYTSDYLVGVWIGDKDNKKSQIYGGNQCCEYAGNIFGEIYDGQKPAPLEKNAGTQSVEIDADEYERNDKILLADPCSPRLSRLKVTCLTDNLPSAESERFSAPKIQNPQIIVNKDNITIQLCQTKYYQYVINRIGNGKKCIYDGKWREIISDKPNKGNYVYEVIPYYDDGKIIHMGTPVELPRVRFDPEGQTYKIPDIVYKDWYNQ